jgi:hypothetical protein
MSRDARARSRCLPGPGKAGVEEARAIASPGDVREAGPPHRVFAHGTVVDFEDTDGSPIGPRVLPRKRDVPAVVRPPVRVNQHALIVCAFADDERRLLVQPRIAREEVASASLERCADERVVEQAGKSLAQHVAPRSPARCARVSRFAPTPRRQPWRRCRGASASSQRYGSTIAWPKCYSTTSTRGLSALTPATSRRP